MKREPEMTNQQLVNLINATPGMTGEERKKAYVKATILSDMAYLLADMADTALLDLDGHLRKFGACTRFEQKRAFNDMIKAIGHARARCGEVSKPIYESPNVTENCENSDLFLKVVKLMTDRLPRGRELREFLENLHSIPSDLHVFDDLSIDDEIRLCRLEEEDGGEDDT